MRVRNRRTGQWIELPQDDGLAARPRNIYQNGRRVAHYTQLISYEQTKAYSIKYMGQHDNMTHLKRWRANYGGNNCLNNMKRPVPIDKTTPSLNSTTLTAEELF